MNPTATKALQILLFLVASIDAGARFAWSHRHQVMAVIDRVLHGMEAAARWCWAHRQQARDAALLMLLATMAAAAWCYRAGRATRRLVDAVCRRSCALLPQQPVQAVAPITATLQALAEHVSSLYPEPATA